MRLGKHEKAVLWALSVFSSANCQWTWHENTGYLSDLADEDDIQRFEAGDYVEVAKLGRDLGIHKAALSRALKTLDQKRLVFLRGADLGLLCGFLTHYTKFVSLTLDGEAKAKVLCNSARLKS